MLQGMSSRMLQYRKWSKTMGRSHKIIRDANKVMSIYENANTGDITLICYTFKPLNWKEYNELVTLMNSYPTRGKKLTTCFGNLKFVENDFYGN